MQSDVVDGKTKEALQVTIGWALNDIGSVDGVCFMVTRLASNSKHICQHGLDF